MTTGTTYEVDNAVVRQKDILINQIIAAEKSTDLREIHDTLVLLAPLWIALGYRDMLIRVCGSAMNKGYDISCEAVVNRSKHRRETSKWAAFNEEHNITNQVISDLARIV